MATAIYQAGTNPISGETFKATSFNGDAFVMEWTVQPKGYVPFEHIHFHQDEIANILFKRSFEWLEKTIQKIYR